MKTRTAVAAALAALVLAGCAAEPLPPRTLSVEMTDARGALYVPAGGRDCQDWVSLNPTLRDSAPLVSMSDGTPLVMVFGEGELRSEEGPDFAQLAAQPGGGCLIVIEVRDVKASDHYVIDVYGPRGLVTTVNLDDNGAEEQVVKITI